MGRKISAAMAAQLSVELDRIADMVSDAVEADLATSYAIATEFRDLTAKRCYGTNVVGKLAKRLGCSLHHVYKRIKVAKMWPTVFDFTTVSTQLDAVGQPLSFSHYIVLATVADSQQRMGLLGQALQGSWCVKHLRAQCGAVRPPGGRTGNKGRARTFDPLRAQIWRRLRSNINNGGCKDNREQLRVLLEHMLRRLPNDELPELAVLIGVPAT